MRSTFVNRLKQFFIIFLFTLSGQSISAGSAISKSVSPNSQHTQQATFIFNSMKLEEKTVKSFSTEQKQKIKSLTNETINETRKLMPELSESIQFTVLITDRNLDAAGGVTGRADRPNEIEITLSSSYKSGLNDAITGGLQRTLFHELHHTVRGWTIYGNKFSQGIDIATINEGLADVFAEIQTSHEYTYYSKDVDFDAWSREILALPKNANYGQWMFSHPDGREAIGYRTGAYLIKRAMKNSGKSILQLSKLSINELYKLAGYQREK